MTLKIHKKLVTIAISLEVNWALREQGGKQIFQCVFLLFLTLNHVNTL